MYIIGVIEGSTVEKCGDSGGDLGEHRAIGVFNYIGWILEHVEGEICSTFDKIDDWFDEEERGNITKY